jgi:arsenite methyltransferase
VPPETAAVAGVIGSAERRGIRAAVRDKYAQVSHSAAGKFQYPTGREGAEKLGYDQGLLNSLPPELLSSYCGVGNPFGIARIEPGSAVLDIGCGAGFDLLVARLQVGDSGRVSGIDLTEEMIARARANLTRAGFGDVELTHVDGDDIPYTDASFDMVISNGVINLSPDKENLFAEISRVLKAGGRLQFADIALEQELPKHLIGSLEAWSQ